MIAHYLTLVRRCFVDTSAYYALADEDDANHELAVSFLERARDEKLSFVTTNFVLAETHALALHRLGRDTALQLVQHMRASAATTIVRVTSADEGRAVAIISGYRDKAFSYTDASSFAVMERLGLTHAFSFDRDFAQFGFTTVPGALT